MCTYGIEYINTIQHRVNIGIDERTQFNYIALVPEKNT